MMQLQSIIARSLLRLSGSYSGMPVVRTDGLAYSHVITETYGAPLRALRARKLLCYHAPTAVSINIHVPSEM